MIRGLDKVWLTLFGTARGWAFQWYPWWRSARPGLFPCATATGTSSGSGCAMNMKSMACTCRRSRTCAGSAGRMAPGR